MSEDGIFDKFAPESIRDALYGAVYMRKYVADDLERWTGWLHYYVWLAHRVHRMTMREIAATVGLSHQRIAQIVKEGDQAGALWKLPKPPRDLDPVPHVGAKERLEAILAARADREEG